MKTFKTFFLTVIVLLSLGLLNKNIAQINLQNGLVAYYPFNGDANDESGNGNNGIAILSIFMFAYGRGKDT